MPRQTAIASSRSTLFLSPKDILRMPQEYSPEELSWIQDQVKKGPRPIRSGTKILITLVVGLLIATIAVLAVSNMLTTGEFPADSIGAYALAAGICAVFLAVIASLAHLAEGTLATDKTHTMTALRGTFETIGRGGKTQVFFNGTPCVMPPGWERFLPIREVVIKAAETRRENHFLVVVEIEGMRTVRQDLERGMSSIRPGKAKKAAIWAVLLVASILPVAFSGAHYGWIAWKELLFHPRERMVVTQLGDLDTLSLEPGREVQLPSLILKFKAPRAPENRSNMIGYIQAPPQAARDSLDSLLAGFKELDDARERLNAVLPGNLGDRLTAGLTAEPLLDAIQKYQGKSPTIWVSVSFEELRSLVQTQIMLESFGNPTSILNYLTTDRGAPVAIVIGKSSKGWMFEDGSRIPAIVSTLRIWLGLVALLTTLLLVWALVQWRKEKAYLEPLEAMAD
ncbi:MAG: hypothetical protein IPO40_03850 [Fibrobacteres bacterium]|nr:hypothetical protein [Fibrobacterota bacterium]